MVRPKKLLGQYVIWLITVGIRADPGPINGLRGSVIEDAIHTDQLRVDPLQRGRCKYKWGRM